MMILYVTNDNQYVDFKTIRERTKRSRTFLNQIFDKVEVRQIYYRNRLLYNVEDLKATEINKFLQ
jgi:hypothetical protein